MAPSLYAQPRSRRLLKQREASQTRPGRAPHLGPAPANGDPESEPLQATLQYNTQSLGDVELLALVLDSRVSRGTARVRAARVLDAAGNLASISYLSASALARVGRLDTRLATRLVAALELGKRAHAEALLDRGEVMGCFELVCAWARPRLAGLQHEEVWLLALDGNEHLVTATRIGQGGLHACALTPRDVLCPALRSGASAIILVHNHPSGDPEPSGEDLAMTHSVASVCSVLGVPLLDHVIVARRGCTSVLELGTGSR